MSEHDQLNGLDDKINTRSFFERILNERDRTEAERDRRLDERFEAQEKAVAAALQAAEKAVAAALAAAEKSAEKAETAQRQVNTSQNEFRGQLKDQNAATERSMMPRAETESLVRELREKFEAGSKELGDLRSRIDVGPPSLGVLQARSDNQQGRQQGISLSAGVLVGGFSVLGVVIGAFILAADKL